MEGRRTRPGEGSEGAAELSSPGQPLGGQGQAESPAGAPILQWEWGWGAGMELGRARPDRTSQSLDVPGSQVLLPLGAAPGQQDPPWPSPGAAGSGRSRPGPPWAGQLRPGRSGWAGCPGCWPVRGSLLPRAKVPAAEPAASPAPASSPDVTALPGSPGAILPGQ